MSTSAQIEANRENSKLSTGPVTEAGKAVSSRNHLVHGLCSADPVLPTEDRNQFNELHKQFKIEWAPEGLQQEILLSQIAVAQWKLDRIARIEIEMIAKLDDPAKAFNDPDTAAGFARLERYRASLERTFHRCSRELFALKKAFARIEANHAKAIEAAQLQALKAELYAPLSQDFRPTRANASHQPVDAGHSSDRS